jgi:Ran GTPase-activating protein (RanGAP) involved in mRNA processing and transport
MLKELNVLGSLYSDHFPIFTRLQFQEKAQEVHESSTPDQDDLEEANEHIKQAKGSLDS